MPACRSVKRMDEIPGMRRGSDCFRTRPRFTKEITPEETAAYTIELAMSGGGSVLNDFSNHRPAGGGLRR